MAMDPELQEYYDNLDEMFGTPAWRGLVEELKAKVYELQASALEAPTWEVVNQLRGQAQAFAYLVNLEEISDAMREQHEQDDTEFDEVVDDADV